jgi:uncharacterized protein YecE (DUF72 family)
MTFPVQVGACGFSYKDWSGHFYPAKLAAAGFLSYYTERFPVVEVDSTFYGSPNPRTVEGWRDKTPDGFGLGAVALVLLLIDPTRPLTTV